APILHFQTDHSNCLQHFNTGDVWLDVRCRTISIDPVEKLLNRAGQQSAAAIADNRRCWMKTWPHNFTLSGSAAVNVVLHGSHDGLIFQGVCKWFSELWSHSAGHCTDFCHAKKGV